MNGYELYSPDEDMNITIKVQSEATIQLRYSDYSYIELIMKHRNMSFEDALKKYCDAYYDTLVRCNHSSWKIHNVEILPQDDE